MGCSYFRPFYQLPHRFREWRQVHHLGLSRVLQPVVQVERCYHPLFRCGLGVEFVIDQVGVTEVQILGLYEPLIVVAAYTTNTTDADLHRLTSRAKVGTCGLIAVLVDVPTVAIGAELLPPLPEQQPDGRGGYRTR